MKGDFSRFTFDEKKHYSKVNKLMGKVGLDSEENENNDIQDYLRKVLIRDVIGCCGTPCTDDGKEDQDGFKIESAPIMSTQFTESRSDERAPRVDLDIGDLFTIRKGRYYVGGSMVQNEETCFTYDQPDLPSVLLGHTFSELIPTKLGISYLVYLDVWERHISWMEDASLIEKAVGRPTTTRTKVIWQTKLLMLDEEKREEAGGACSLSFLLESLSGRRTNGQLKAYLNPKYIDDCYCDPCCKLEIQDQGYLSLENLLYRVEIHHGTASKYLDPALEPSFKWTNDNGNQIGRITQIDPDNNSIIIIKEIDFRSTLHCGDWLEVINDYHELWNLPGVIVRISEIHIHSQEEYEIIYDRSTLSDYDRSYIAGFGDLLQSPAETHLKAVYWKGYSKFKPGEPYQLDNGIEIEFKQKCDDDKDCNYNSGDYWFIPSRHLSGIEWPQGKDGHPLFCMPSGIEHHYCPIAVFKYEGSDELIIKKWDIDEFSDFVEKVDGTAVSKREKDDNYQLKVTTESNHQYSLIRKDKDNNGNDKANNNNLNTALFIRDRKIICCFTFDRTNNNEEGLVKGKIKEEILDCRQKFPTLNSFPCQEDQDKGEVILDLQNRVSQLEALVNTLISRKSARSQKRSRKKSENGKTINGQAS